MRVVTINYRLGRFGFFAHPALTREDPNGPLVNFGIMDQIAALKWTRANIAASRRQSGRRHHLRQIRRRHRRQQP